MKIIKKIILNKWIAKMLMKTLLQMHHGLNKLIGRMATVLNDGIHPKIEIMQYEQWFCDNIPANAVVLDIGSHLGKMAERMAHKASKVIGIEIVKSLYDESVRRTKRTNIQLIHGDATTMDLGKLGAIEIVTLSNVLEHIESRVEFLKNLIKNLKRSPGEKTLLIRVPMIDRDWLTTYKRTWGVEWRLDPTHYTEYTMQEFRNELSSASLYIEKYEIKYGEIWASCKIKSEF
jgi:ubiquinone/menaquinone biosynthesis C-methylase UbiE